MAAPGITKRSDGLLCATLQVNGVRRYVYGKTEREVKTKLADLQRQVATAGSLPDPGRRMVDDLLDEWLSATKPTLKAKTWADYDAVCRRYVRPAIGRVKLARFTPNHVQALYASLQAKDYNRIPDQVHDVLHRACELGVLWRWLAENPCDRVLKPTYQAPRKEVWDHDELRAFLEGAASHTLYPLWVTLLATGCRLGELLGLSWADVDLAPGAVKVRGNLQRIRGEWVKSTPKTQAGERTITLPAEGVTALKAQRARLAEWRLKAGADWQDGGLVFAGLHGQPLQPSVVEHALARECERLGLPKTTPHGLRHLHASLLLDAGLPVPLVSARLGHARPSITMSIYAHKVGQDDRRAADALARALGG